jgi:DNA repair protein RecO (recombination protein O)
MYLTTEAIVLQLHPYKDNSAVVKLYTQQMGLLSCWVSSIHKKTSKTRASILQPLSITNAEISHKENNNLTQLKEIEIAVHTNSITMNVEKSSIAIFLSELILKCLKESSQDESLYAFVRESICMLDATKERCANFPIVFVLRLSEQLGLLPKGINSALTPYFNLEESIYQAHNPLHPHYLDATESKWLSELTSLPMEQFYIPVVPSDTRKKLLRGLLEYFELHFGMAPLKSYLVLEEVF